MLSCPSYVSPYAMHCSTSISHLLVIKLRKQCKVGFLGKFMYFCDTFNVFHSAFSPINITSHGIMHMKKRIAVPTFHTLFPPLDITRPALTWKRIKENYGSYITHTLSTPWYYTCPALTWKRKRITYIQFLHFTHPFSHIHTTYLPHQYHPILLHKERISDLTLHMLLALISEPHL